MIVVIDGYNLLKQIFPGVKGSLEKQRSLFIQQLAHYQAKKAKEISELVVVFDAGPSTHATREVKSGIVVVFSGIRSNADQWILDFVERKKGQEILVVTLDRALREACQKQGADTLSVYDFYTVMQRILLEEATATFVKNGHQVGLEKYEDLDDDVGGGHGVNTQALDLLMEQASIGIAKDDDYSDNRTAAKKSKSYTPSKQERRLAAKLKKLG
jgi:predicted RNA-binding protein with PIN domain